MAEPVRLIQELVISFGAATVLYLSGQHLLGWVLGVTSIIHHALVYSLGGRLIRVRCRAVLTPRNGEG
jgi:hypothetical protein